MNKRIIKTEEGVEIHILTDGTEAEYNAYASAFKEEKKPIWAPQNRAIFLQDVRKGLDFCRAKYGVSMTKITKYIKKALPHIDVDKFKGGK